MQWLLNEFPCYRMAQTRSNSPWLVTLSASFLLRTLICIPCLCVQSRRQLPASIVALTSKPEYQNSANAKMWTQSTAIVRERMQWKCFHCIEIHCSEQSKIFTQNEYTVKCDQWFGIVQICWCKWFWVFHTKHNGDHATLALSALQKCCYFVSNWHLVKVCNINIQAFPIMTILCILTLCQFHNANILYVYSLPLSLLPAKNCSPILY